MDSTLYTLSLNVLSSLAKGQVNPSKLSKTEVNNLMSWLGGLYCGETKEGSDSASSREPLDRNTYYTLKFLKDGLKSARGEPPKQLIEMIDLNLEISDTLDPIKATEPVTPADIASTVQQLKDDKIGSIRLDQKGGAINITGTNLNSQFAKEMWDILEKILLETKRITTEASKDKRRKESADKMLNETFHVLTDSFTQNLSRVRSNEEILKPFRLILQKLQNFKFGILKNVTVATNWLKDVVYYTCAWFGRILMSVIFCVAAIIISEHKVGNKPIREILAKFFEPTDRSGVIGNAIHTILSSIVKLFKNDNGIGTSILTLLRSGGDLSINLITWLWNLISSPTRNILTLLRISVPVLLAYVGIAPSSMTFSYVLTMLSSFPMATGLFGLAVFGFSDPKDIGISAIKDMDAMSWSQAASSLAQGGGLFTTGWAQILKSVFWTKEFGKYLINVYIFHKMWNKMWNYFTASKSKSALSLPERLKEQRQRMLDFIHKTEKSKSITADAFTRVTQGFDELLSRMGDELRHLRPDVMRLREEYSLSRFSGYLPDVSLTQLPPNVFSYTDRIQSETYMKFIESAKKTAKQTKVSPDVYYALGIYTLMIEDTLSKRMNEAIGYFESAGEEGHGEAIRKLAHLYHKTQQAEKSQYWANEARAMGIELRITPTRSKPLKRGLYTQGELGKFKKHLSSLPVNTLEQIRDGILGLAIDMRTDYEILFTNVTEKAELIKIILDVLQTEGPGFENLDFRILYTDKKNKGKNNNEKKRGLIWRVVSSVFTKDTKERSTFKPKTNGRNEIFDYLAEWGRRFNELNKITPQMVQSKLENDKDFKYRVYTYFNLSETTPNDALALRVLDSIERYEFAQEKFLTLDNIDEAYPNPPPMDEVELDKWGRPIGAY